MKKSTKKASTRVCDESGFCINTSGQMSEPKPTKNSKLMYFGDPMCSWCWGITNHLEKVINHFEGRIKFELVMGGLRPGGGDSWDDNMKNFLKGHWRHVHEASGQEFNYGLFERNYFNYDTEPACRAVAIVKKMNPEVLFDFYKNVQYGFYVEGRDPKEVEFYEDICNSLAIDYKAFTEVFSSDEGKILVSEDFNKTRRYGISGFPTMILQVKDRLEHITNGYATYENMKERIEALS